MRAMCFFSLSAFWVFCHIAGGIAGTTFKDGIISSDTIIESSSGSENAAENLERVNEVAIPKYFFANELSKETCPLEGVHGHGSWGKTYWELDLAITHVSKKKNPELQGNNYDHLMLSLIHI